jgi:hypothetical protein
LVCISDALSTVVTGELVSEPLVVAAKVVELSQGGFESPAERFWGGTLAAGDSRIRPRRGDT